MERDEFIDLVGADYVDEYEKAQLSQEDATIVAKSKRTFVELLVHYPHPDVCTYPEYKGKPYYSIKYIEDGECFVGFGTYKPEVLSQYLRDYFMPPAQPEQRWIPVSERRPEEHESMFTRFYGSERWNRSMWLRQSDRVIVTSELADGTRITETATTRDGEWKPDHTILKREIVAWMPMPKPYKGETDETY